MNVEIILSMVEPYVKDGEITYDEFDNIFSMLSKKEQYRAVEILNGNGISLVDSKEDQQNFVLDIDNEQAQEEFTLLYDDSIFQDKTSLVQEELVINEIVNQSNENLCYLIQQGNKQAEQDLCTKNIRLVDKYVLLYQKRYGNRLDFEDLEQVGLMGLIKAAKKFDFSQNTSFSTYAVFWIKQAISREIMDNGYAIRIPVHMMERINKVMALDIKLIEEQVEFGDRIVTISDTLGLTEEKVRECLVLKNNYLTYTSLDLPIGAEEDSMLGDFIPDEEAPTIDEVVSWRMLKDDLIELLDALTEKEAKILRLRFGLDDDKARTLEEIGHVFGVTRERIRQIEAKALRKLRHPSRSKKIKDYL